MIIQLRYDIIVNNYRYLAKYVGEIKCNLQKEIRDIIQESSYLFKVIYMLSECYARWWICVNKMVNRSLFRYLFVDKHIHIYHINLKLLSIIIYLYIFIYSYKLQFKYLNKNINFGLRSNFDTPLPYNFILLGKLL